MILLYNPPSSASRKPVLPMSLLALGAVLEGRYDYRILDGNLERDAYAVIDHAVERDGITVIGMTVMPGPQLAHAIPLSKHLKSKYPHLTIIWGGYFPTQHYDVVLRADYVDYVVRGHGEEAFTALLDILARDGVPLDIPGTAYRNPDGSFQASMPAAIPHPDHLPDFPYHRVDLGRYIRRTFMGERTLPHHSSYGCPFFCNFCAVVNMVNGRWLAQSAERTANVVRGLVEDWQLDAMEFYDNNFFTSEKRVREFSERITNLNIAWWGEGRIDTMIGYSDATWQAMADSGLRMVFLGAESGSDATLKRMDKGGRASTAKTLEIAAKMAHYGVVPEMSFVMGNPPDPVTDVEETIAFIRKVKRVNPATEVILYMYTPVPLGGELYDQAKADGFAFPETLEGWVSDEWQDFVQRRSSQVPWMQDPLRQRVRDFERVLNAYYPTVTDAKLQPTSRKLLRALSAPRYYTATYRYPLELRALQKVLHYQRPETTGF